MNKRLEKAQAWLKGYDAFAAYQWQALAGDAGSRCYYRLQGPNDSYILMDSQADPQSTQAFIAIDKAFAQRGIRVPDIIAANKQAGLVVLSDFGDNLYLDALTSDTADALYQKALASLLPIAKCQALANWDIPHFDAVMMRVELQRFTQWFLGGLLKFRLSPIEQRLLDKTYQKLINAIQQQVTVCVHRDYHSRNLMLLPDGDVGVLDFQDAVWGPLCYDAVSLLRDCYIAWPHHDVYQWALSYRDSACEAGLMSPVSDQHFIRDFDYVSLQRHIKCVGIFARLKLRDNKSRYIGDIPRVLRYIKEVSEFYSEFNDFRHFLNERVIPRWQRELSVHD